jgi:hypothetical protein
VAVNVLIKGEFSGVVREAFRKRGHNAWSNDLLPAEDGSKFHILGNYEEVAGEWDLGIYHPPCTFLCNSGVKHLYRDGKKTNGRDEQRWADMQKAAEFFKHWLNSPIPRKAVENPIMHGYAKEIIGVEQTQIIQPWMFGHGEIKATCLWLHSLPLLTPTKIVDGRVPRVHHASPGPDRWKERSRTLQGIADAMAEQWGVL